MKLLLSDNGASSAEYALILAVIGAGIALAAINLGVSIKDALDQTATTIRTCANQC